MGSRPSRPAILLVDDDALVLSAHSRLLERAFAVSVALDGRAALQLLQTRRVDLIVSDHGLPGMTGSELLAEVRRRHPRVRRVLCSARPPASCDAAELIVEKPWPHGFARTLTSMLEPPA